MSGQLSNYAENKILDHVLKNTAFTRPAHLFLALLTAEPGDTDSGSTITEVSGGSYARRVVDSWDSAVSRATANSTLITFPEATATWGAVSHFAILDTSTLATGKIFIYGALAPAKTIETGVDGTIAKGDLDVSFDTGGVSDYAANKILDHLLKGTAFAQPTSLFIGLSTSTIIGSMTGSAFGEPSGNNYSRVVENNWSAASGGASDNEDVLQFATASGAWGTIKGMAVLSANATGNILFFANLSTSRIVSNGDVPKFPIGAIDISMD